MGLFSILKNKNLISNETKTISAKDIDTKNIQSQVELLNTNNTNISIAIQQVANSLNNLASVTLNQTEEILNTNSIDLDSSLKSLQQSFTTINTSVDILISKLESVNTITVSMNNIANQINLLSLNAAIEAAHAGQSGLGFSVIANEFKKISITSKHSVQNINHILDDIKSDLLKISKQTTTDNQALSTQESTL